LSPWRWSRYLPPKRRFLQKPHGVTSHKTEFFIVTTVKSSNLISVPCCYLQLMNIYMDRTQPEWSFLSVLTNTIMHRSFWIIDSFAAALVMILHVPLLVKPTVHNHFHKTSQINLRLDH
jgi:hypothetical protein